MTELTESSGIYSLHGSDDWFKAYFTGCAYDQHKIKEFLEKTGLDQAQLHRIHQSHSSNIHVVNKEIVEEEKLPEVDGIFSSQPGSALIILTADCVPIYLWDSTIPLIGLVHAGWRGLKWGILYRAIKTFRETYQGKVENINVALGPSIKSCCYEVGSEFEEYFPSVYVRSETDTNKGKIDLQRIVMDQLTDQGISEDQIFDVGLCTSCEHKRFHSYRADQTELRNLSLIHLPTK